MIEFINSWVQSIVVAVIVVAIIEMILPNGSSKKYIRVVLGIYVLFHIITPIMNKISNGTITMDFNIDQYEQEIASHETFSQKLETSNQSNIRDMYQKQLKKDVTAKLEEKGYQINSLQIVIKKDDTYAIEKITMSLLKEKKKLIDNESTTNKVVINEVHISVQKETKQKEISQEEDTRGLTIAERNELKQYISSTYDVKQEAILINET